MKSVKGLLMAGIVLLLATAFSLIIPIAIWPGEMKLVGPYVCADDQSDAMVVADTKNTRPGETYTSFKLYCVGARGDYVDAGLRRPLGLLAVAHFVLLALYVAWRALRRKLRAKKRDSGPSPAGQSDATETIAAGPIIR